jgi:hypothetical protein
MGLRRPARVEPDGAWLASRDRGFDDAVSALMA